MVWVVVGVCRDVVEPGGVDSSAGDGEELEVTGLSGVEDIVGEMIEKGEIEPRHVGLTEQQAHKLTQHAR